jgi:HlyD family secretion protein
MKTIKKMTKRSWIITGIIGVVVVLVIVIVAVIASRRAANNSAFQTEVLAKGDLTAIVGATGTVSSDRSAILNWQTSGQVQNVNVQIGDTVTSNQILADLLQSSLPQSVILATSDLVTAKRNLTDLQLSGTSAAQAYQALVAAQKTYDDAKDKIRSTDWVRGSKETRAKYYDQLLQAQTAYDNAVTYYNDFVNLPDTNAGKARAYDQLASAQHTLDSAKANYDFVSGTFSITEVQQSDADFQVAKAQLEDAQREYDRLKNGPDPLDIAAAQARVDAIQATLDSAKQMAPFTGTVTEALSNVGDLITPGTEAFRIDDLQHLSVDIQITEIDITKVAVGQDSTLVFDAIPDKTYVGTVTKVAKAGDVVQGVANFSVTVELKNADSSVMPGMTAAVNITVSNIADVLVVPNRAIRVINGVTTVYVLKNGVATPVTITLGASSDTDSEVTAGNLKVGDLIILNPPTSIIPSGGGGGGGNPFGGNPFGG